MPLEPLPDPLIGRTLHGKYKIVSLLGEGGMGAVYAGEQALGPTVRRVAIKTLHRHLSRDEKIRERFHREVGTLASLEHPNTVQVFDFGTTDDGLLFIVMEFVQGQSLAAEIEKGGPIAAVRARKIVAQICGSLAEAHGKGIVHRDLKPDNIVLTERAGQRDFVKVLDFGIAKRSGEEDRNEAKLTQQGTVVGTPPYMSPEQFTGQPLDARSDIYSLGIVAYELLTGQLPFDAQSPWEWATLHMTAAPKPIEATPNGDALPSSMRHAIMRALAKHKDERFATILQFEQSFTSDGSANAAGLPAGSAPGATTDMPATVGPPKKAAAEGYAHVSGDAAKGKTQIGDVVVPAEYGPPPGAYGPPPGAYAPPVAVAAPYDAGRYGPPPGNVTPPSARGSGSKRGLLLGIAAVGALVSGLAIAAGMGAFDTRESAPVPPLDLGQTTTVATTTTATSPVATTATTDFGSATPLAQPAPLDVPKETPAAQPKPKPATPPQTPKPTPQVPTPTPQGPTPTPQVPTPTPQVPTPTPQVPTPTPQVPTPTPSTEPAACRSARTARARGQAASIIAALEARCRAGGGTP